MEATGGLVGAAGVTGIAKTTLTMAAVSGLQTAGNEDWSKPDIAIRNVVKETTLGALSGFLGGKASELIGEEIVTALKNSSLNIRAVKALTAAGGGVSFALVQSGIVEAERMADAAANGREYQPDYESIATNVIAAGLFGSLEMLKSDPQAVKLQTLMKSGDPAAIKLVTDYVNAHVAELEAAQAKMNDKLTQSDSINQQTAKSASERLINAGVNQWNSAETTSSGKTISKWPETIEELLAPPMIPQTTAPEVPALASVDLKGYTERAGNVGKVITVIRYKPSSGATLKANPNKTTTVLGNFEKDMKNIVNEMGYVKSTYFGAQKGGFNVLNVPDDMYKNAGQFWYEVNVKWLDEAIARGDDFILATKPTNDVLWKIDPVSRTKTLTGFGREYQHMIDNGYVYDPLSNMMVESEV